MSNKTPKLSQHYQICTAITLNTELLKFSNSEHSKTHLKSSCFHKVIDGLADNVGTDNEQSNPDMYYMSRFRCPITQRHYDIPKCVTS